MPRARRSPTREASAVRLSSGRRGASGEAGARAHKRPGDLQMSAIHSDADEHKLPNNVGEVPIGIGLLFDHFVGASEEHGWNVEPECLRGLEINDQFELRRLLDR